MSKARAILVGAVIAASVVTPVILQYQTNVRLKAENEALRSQAVQGSTHRASEKAVVDMGEQARLREEHNGNTS